MQHSLLAIARVLTELIVRYMLTIRVERIMALEGSAESTLTHKVNVLKLGGEERLPNVFYFRPQIFLMTVILGILSILQAIFLPGYLTTRFFYPLKGISCNLVSFALSPLINYQFVFILTALGLYGRPSVFILFGLECLALIWLTKQTRAVNHRKNEELRKLQLSTVVVKEPFRPGFNAVFFAFSLIITLSITIKILDGNPGVFNSWDDVVSWNRWAVDWYGGQLPIRTYHYPQLIPANWSMMYHFVGTPDIQFFAKSIMGLFALAILVIFYDLFKKFKSDFFLAACAWSGFLILSIVGSYIGTGYMDVPITFFCLIVLYVLLLTVTGYLPIFRGFVLASVLLATCILIKQAGLFMLFPFAVACIIILSKNRLSVSRKTLLAYMVSGYLLLAGPWYLYKEIQMQQRVEESEVSWVTKDIYAGKSKMQRLEEASVKFRESVTEATLITALPEQARPTAKLLFFTVLIALSLLSTLNSYGRFVLFSTVLPYYLIWGLYFSYDLRNVALLLPFWGFLLGIGTVVTINFWARWEPKFRRWTLLSAMLLIIIACSIRFPKQKLLTVERGMAAEQLMDSAMNHLLYQHYDSGNLKGKVLNSYPMMAFLPELKRYVEPFSFDEENLAKLKTILEKEKGTYQFCILNDGAPPAVWEYFKVLESRGYIKSKTRTNPGWNLIELNPNL